MKSLLKHYNNYGPLMLLSKKITEFLHYIYIYKSFEGVRIIRELRKENTHYIAINLKLYLYINSLMPQNYVALILKLNVFNNQCFIGYRLSFSVAADWSSRHYRLITALKFQNR